MKFFQVILAVAAFIAVTVDGKNFECLSMCPGLYDPTCATDGTDYKLFDSVCELNNFNCNRYQKALTNYVQTDIDWCTTTEWDENLDIMADVADTDPSCVTPCLRILDPVCASNGTYRKTFSNDCVMKSFDCIFKSQNKQGWRLLKNDNCSR